MIHPYLISQIKVKEIMTKDPITVPKNFTVEETAQILLKNKIKTLPKEGSHVPILNGYGYSHHSWRNDMNYIDYSPSLIMSVPQIG